MDTLLYVIDDEESITNGIKLALEDDYDVRAFGTAEAALSALKREAPDVILLDIGLPGMNGVEALAQFKRLHPHIPVIMITAFEDVSTVVSAMKHGAYDYIVKPLHMDGLEVTIKNALDTIKLRKEVKSLQARFLQDNMPCFIAESRAILDVMDFIETVARSPDTPILLVGETGTGKELIASSIHYRSPNFRGPLTTVNCAAIPKDLIESELFGYEEGAFSGARKAGKKGLIEQSANGTLFLDEVGDLSLDAQAKLLRFLEAGEFYRIGGTKKFYVKTRVVSATNKNVEEMIERKRFRKDLYFRLAVIKVEIPSLKERRKDILPLARFFLDRYTQKFGKKISGLSAAAEKALMEHDWMGNVRELKNMVERAALIGKQSEVTPADLGLDSKSAHLDPKSRQAPEGFPPIPESGVDLPELEKAMEWFYIEQAYKMADGNESKAAKLLNINHHTYRYRRKKLLEE